MADELVNRRDLFFGGASALGAVAGLGCATTGPGGPPPPQPPPPQDGVAWIDVRDHGAVGDGTTDDRAAIVAAANVAAAAGPSTLYFPAGTYLINDGPPPELGDDVTALGEGAASVLKRGAATTYFGILVNQDYLQNRVGNRNIAVVNLTFDDNGANQTPPFNEFKHGVAFIGVDNGAVRGCRFINLSGDGVYVGSTITTARENHSRNIRITDNHFAGGELGRNGVSIIDATNLIIANNTFVGVASDVNPGGIDLEPNLPGQDIINVAVIGNTFDNCRQGIQAYGAIDAATGVKSGLVISGNAVRGSRNQGIGIRVSEFDQVTVADNAIVDTAHAGLLVEDGTEITVSGNVIRGTGMERPAPGLWLRNCPSAVIGSNAVHDSEGDAIQIDGCNMFSLVGNAATGWDREGTGDHYGIRGVNRSVGGIITGNTFDGAGRERTTLMHTERGCEDWNIANNLFRNVERKFDLSGRNRVEEDSN